MHPGPSRWIVGIGLVTVVVLFWVFRIWSTGTEVTLLASDVFLYYLPTYETLYGTLLEGRLPLWNPYQLCGIPRLASLQAGFFYPGHLLYLLLPVQVAFAVSGLAHLALVAGSTAAFVRRLGLGAGAALVAALLVAIRGRYPGMVFFPNMLEAAAWLPLGAVAVLGLVRGGGPRPAALLAVCTGLSLLAGYPQLSVYSVYGWAGLFAGLALLERPDAPTWRRGLAWFAGAVALGALVAAIQLLPGWELTTQGTRSPGTLSRWQQFPFGRIGWGVLDGIAKALYAPFPLLALSFGWTAIACAVAGFFSRSHRVLAIACTALAALVVLFAMGPVTPVFDWIAGLPALGWFRFPRRALFLVDFFVAIVAAIGAMVLQGRLRDRSAGPASGARAWAFVGLIPLVIVVEVFTAPPNREALFFEPGALDVYSDERPIYRRIRESGERVWIRSVGIRTRRPPKLATYFEIRSVGDYEPLNLRRQAEYFTYLMEGRLDPARGGRPYSGRLKHLTAPTYPGALAARVHLLDLAGVRWFVLAKRQTEVGEIAETIEARGLVPEPVEDPDLVLLRNPHALPRAFVVHDVREAPDPLALMAAMSDPDFDPLAWSYAEGVGPRSRPGPRGAPARIVRDEETLVEVEAVLPAPGMLVLADSFYPGWVATAGDEELEILPANHLFRGVLLPAGRHRVRFEYRPWTLPVGATASAFGIAGVAALLRAARRRPVLPAPSRSDSIRADD